MKAARLHKLHRAVDRHVAERVAITPMRSGGYLAGAPDDFDGYVDAYVASAANLARTSGNAANSGHNVELRGATHSAKFTTTELGFTVKSGFLLTRLEDPCQERFRVVAVLPFGTDRTVLLMVRTES